MEKYIPGKATVIFAFGLYVLAGCASPRDDCEASLNEDTCLIMAALQSDCRGMIQAGLATPTECNAFDKAAISACLLSMEEKNKCNRKSDLPLIPKIVIRSIAPNADRSAESGEALAGRFALTECRSLASSYHL
ncbi:MAG: hypothetical protein F9K24_21550 [Leptonema illini]|uniref:Lipoprotein n=1 Tax=Leptonema illini TaxID=183 RepID=A0A833GX66_9LEPT|nr:MAG: hypothetical protein F9K24_21550 [Leptonema illini]